MQGQGAGHSGHAAGCRSDSIVARMILIASAFVLVRFSSARASSHSFIGGGTRSITFTVFILRLIFCRLQGLSGDYMMAASEAQLKGT